jgi:hypothetical protein
MLYSATRKFCRQLKAFYAALPTWCPLPSPSEHPLASRDAAEELRTVDFAIGIFWAEKGARDDIWGLDCARRCGLLAGAANGREA